MFQLGKAPPKPKGTVHRRIPSKKPSISHPITYKEAFPRKPSWLLLPRERLTPYQWHILTVGNPSFLEMWLAAYSLENVFSPTSKQYLFLRAFHPSPMTFEEIQEEVKKAFELNQSLRFSFKSLLNAWRFRKFETVNSVDVVTQEAIEKPVYSYDWTLRKRYQFEASTILRDSTLRLMNHNGLMMESLPPRNILTNTAFSQAQCACLYKQMLAHGITNNHWECFARSGFNVKTLLYTYEVPMRLEILQRMFSAYSWEAADILLDFVDAQYRLENALMPDESLLLYVLKRHWTSSYVSHWIRLCKQDWAAQIRPYSHTDTFKALIARESAELIHNDGWTALFKQKK